MRAWKSVGGSTTYFLYDGSNPVCELDGSSLGDYAFDAFGLRTGTDATTDPYSSFGGQCGYYADERRNKSLTFQMGGQACSRLSFR